MKKLILSLALCATVICANASGKWQMGANPFTVDTIYHATIGPGMTSTGLRLSGADNNTNTIKTNIFYTTIDLTNPNLELRGVQAQDHPDKAESVLSMGNRKNGQGNGQYMAGINGDFFNMGKSPTRTNGHSLVDGRLYNLGASGQYWPYWASYATVVGEKDITIDTGVSAARGLRFPNGQTHSVVVDQAWRGDNCLAVYTPAFGSSTGTNEWGRECTMKLISGSIDTGNAVFEITSDWVGNMDGSKVGNMAIPANGYVLSATGDAFTMMAQLKIGDRITSAPIIVYRGQQIDARQAIGGCTMLVMEGKVAPDDYLSANVIDHFTSNQARTAIGYNKDRTKLIILVADKYSSKSTSDSFKSSYATTSTGFAVRRMAQLMVNLGCYTAMNFDGGGSSQFYNKGFGLRNLPYGGDIASDLRVVANGFFAVETTPVDNTVAMIEVYQKDVKLTTGGKFTPTVCGYNKYGVLVNKNLTGFSLNVAPSMGSVSGTTFTAGSAAATTKAVVTYNGIKCGVNITTNSGKSYVTSGDDNVNVMIKAPYIPDESLGLDKEPPMLTEQWSFVNTNYNDGWDGNACNWSSPDAIKAKNCMRYATARNGRFYTVDMKTMSIAEIDPEGNMTPLYKLPSLEGRTINGTPDYYGTAISSDDYGNFLIGHLLTLPDSYRVWTVYCPKTGKAKHFEVKLPAGEGSNGRIDNIGRVVGDLTNEAYAFVAPVATSNTATNKALILHFKNSSSDKADFDGLELTGTMSLPLYMAGGGNSNSIIQPRYTSLAEMSGKDIDDTYYWYSKAGGIGQWNQDLFTRDNGNYSANYATTWNNASALNGFDTFVMAGKRYFVVAYSKDGEKKNNQHIIIKDEKSTTVAEWNNEAFDSDNGYNTITAVPIDNNNVNIYVYNCTNDFYVNGTKTGAIAGALLRFSIGEFKPDSPVDITPSGLDFSSYADGAEFKLTALEAAGSTTPTAMVSKHPDAFSKDGHLTVYIDRNSALDKNTQSYVNAEVQPGYVVRTINKHIGKVLAVTQLHSPGYTTYEWPAAASGNLAQLNFYVPNKLITNKPDQRHYIRVRIVYNILYRGCHYAQNAASNTVITNLPGIYATHENGGVVPTLDNQTGSLYAETGINFAQWVNETGHTEDIPTIPEVRQPSANETDPWDAKHGQASADPTGYPAYVMNDSRYRIYEFDTYIDNPSAASLGIQFNMTNKFTNFFIKEIQFTDLGTDEASANLLGRRQLGWQYFEKETSGIDNILNDSAIEESAAIYYNLQGVEVRNPENGIYIVRRGNKVTKEFIR